MPMPHTDSIRACGVDDTARILGIINEAAVAYRGVIPEELLHDPYMTSDELQRDIGRGVSFAGMDVDGTLAGVMGIQRVRDSDLIRHAYVLSAFQRYGIGGSLLRHLTAATSRQLLVGTWADATWAVSFYQRHGFTLADPVQTKLLLGAYWEIPTRQAEASVVLVRSPISR
jgi:GNAT superfamily N-acetyltransferase